MTLNNNFYAQAANPLRMRNRDTREQWERIFIASTAFVLSECLLRCSVGNKLSLWRFVSIIFKASRFSSFDDCRTICAFYFLQLRIRKNWQNQFYWTKCNVFFVTSLSVVTKFYKISRLRLLNPWTSTKAKQFKIYWKRATFFLFLMFPHFPWTVS